MALDLGLLRLVKHRKEFSSLYNRIPLSAMDKQTQAIIKDFGVYFEKFPEANVVNMELFLPVFRSLHPSLKDEDVGAYAKVFGNLGVDLSEDDILGLLKS
ncbi:hypothetical protein, partial [uncultured Paraglaciecola sp.]|uniref:hypothetical protein n=1 Tax=uncultured Paraglaciecola sp. TaxID=1765024 RepID=UPI002616E97A